VLGPDGSLAGADEEQEELIGRHTRAGLGVRVEDKGMNDTANDDAYPLRGGCGT
jgi:hypothetical protein